MQHANTLAIIREQYRSRAQIFNTTRKGLENKIHLRQRQIERLQTRLKKIHWPRWTEELLRPVLDEIKKHLPGWHCDDEQLSPMGLGCRVSVFFTPKRSLQSADRQEKEKILYITFLPGDLDNAELRYETGQQTKNYRPGTIGEINGFNRISKSLESIQEAVDFLKAQY